MLTLAAIAILWAWIDLSIQALFNRGVWVLWMTLHSLALGFFWQAEGLATFLGVGVLLGAIWGLVFHAWKEIGE